MYYVNPVIKNFVRTYQSEDRYGYVRLDQNENPDGLPKWLFDEAMSRITPEYIAMYPEEGKLTEKYAKLLGVDREQVAFTDGSVVAMGYVIKVFGEPNKKLICATPTFGMYKVYADMVGMNTVFIHYEDDYSFDIDKILDAIDEDTGLVSLVNPNMPIGNAYKPEEIRKIVEKAHSLKKMVIIDEAYFYFYENTSINLLKEYDNIIILRTFSKMLSITGLRLGAVISTKQNVQYIKNYRPHYTVNGIALIFGEAIVDNHEKVIKELEGKFREGKACILDSLKKNDYSYLPTQGCFICITPKHKSAEYITDELKKRNILIFCGKGDSAGFLRVTIWDKKYMELFMQNLLEIDIP